MADRLPAAPGRRTSHRKRLAGEAGLDDEQVLAGEQADVGGDHVAGGEDDDVAGHELGQRELAQVRHRAGRSR